MSQPTYKILLVEDSRDDEALALQALQDFGITDGIYIVRDGAEAVAYLLGEGAYQDRARYPLPCFVILDLKLPKLSGIEVLQRARANPATRLLPIVIFTSSNEERDLLDSYHFGANSYVRKPIDYDEFSEAVQKLGIYWSVLNEPAPRRIQANGKRT